MLDRMQRLKRAVSRRLAGASAPDRARAARDNNLRHLLEGLESRVVMATDTWLPGGGGIWDLPGNWSTGKVPTATDDVVINMTSVGTVQITKAGDAALSLTANSNSAIQVNIGGTFALGGGTSSISGATTGTPATPTGGIQIVPGATMTIAPKATVALSNAIITDQGSLTVGNGSTFTLSGGQTTPGYIDVQGVFTTTGSTYTGGSYTDVIIEAGGRMTATSNTFSTAGFDVEPNAIITTAQNGNIVPLLTGNDFSGTDFGINSTAVPLVTNNKAFGLVDITDDFLPSGVALNLTKMGTGVTPANNQIRYRFEEGYEVTAGSALTVDPNVPLIFDYTTSQGTFGSPLTIDAGGQLYLNQGDSVTLFTHINSPQTPPEGPITVNGLLSATGVSFVTPPSVSAYNTAIRVNAGSTFLATNCGFEVGSVSFADNSLANSFTEQAVAAANAANGTNVPLGGGVVTGNDFSATLVTIRAADVPVITNNLQFSNVALRSPSLAAGQSLDLTAMGTRSSANLIYILLHEQSTQANPFGAITINTGATLTVDPNVRINLYDNGGPNLGDTLVINGTVNFGQGDLVRMYSTPPDTSKTPPVTYPQGVSQIIVNGVMNVTGTNFITVSGSLPTTSITVGSGGEVIGAGNDFAATDFVLSPGSVLNANDLTGNEFAFTTLTLPSDYLALITNNLQFSEVDLTTPLTGANQGGVGAGQELDLTAMGTVTASTLSYVFVNNFTIAPTGVVNVAPNLPVSFTTIDPTTQANTNVLDVYGTLNLNTGDVVSFGTINVGDGTDAATMNAPGTVFNRPSGFVFFSPASTLTVNANATFAGIGDTGNITSLTFGPGATASLQLSNLTTSLSVDGTTNETITGNNFINTHVTATGDYTATPTIPMGGNYWGTTDPAAIDKNSIFDHLDNAALPRIDFNTIVKGIATIVASPATAVYGSQPQVITLNANVSGVTGTVNTGTVTIGVYNGSTLIGTEQKVTLTNGAVSVQYTIPAFLPVGLYSIHATYDDPSFTFLDSIDTSHFLTITQATAVLTAPSGGNTANYNANAVEPATLTAAVTSTVGVVNEGTVTFQVFTNDAAPVLVGTLANVSVVNGVATGTINLPKGTPVGTFTINVVFNGSKNYAPTDVQTATLTVLPAVTAVTVNSPSVTYSTAPQTISLSSQVNSAGAVGGVVGEGTVTFTLVAAGTAIGTPVTVNVVNGVATGTYTIPGGVLAGQYTIQAAYSGTGNSGTGNFADSTSTAGLVTINKADTATVATSRTLAYNPVDGTVALSANVTSLAGTVNEGTVTFQLFNGTTPLGTATAGAVVNGVATANYQLPGGLEVGTTYTIVVSFDGSTDFLASADSAGSHTTTGTLTIVQATPIMGVGADTGTYTPQGEYVGAHALVLVGSTPINEGTVTFTVYNGTTAIASSAAVAVGANGRADAPVFLPAGTLAGGAYTIVASYSGSSHYTVQTASNVVTVAKANPALAWAAPVDIVYGTPLTDAQLDAVASVAGTFAYTPAAGTVLNAGASQVLTAAFTPTDATDYNPGTVATTINVAQAVPTFGFLTASQVAQYTQPTIAVTGILAAGTTVPVGATVQVSVAAGQQTSSAVATVNPDGTFTANVPLNGLAVGAYAIQYSFAGNNNFAPASNNATVLNVVRASQAITTFNAPTSAVYGTTFHVDVASSSGLPVTLTATNASVVANPLGGYDVTMLSGTDAAILVASQAGNGNYADAAPIVLPVAAVKAQATVALANLGIYTDSGPHTVSASTSPVGLNVPISYSLNGVPVVVPNAVGTYTVTASIVDPNYQGSASGVVVIVSAGGNGGGTTPVVGPVAVSAVTTTLNKQKAVSAINLTFNGDLSAASVANLGNYRLATPGKGGSFTAKNAKTYKIKAASYDPVTHTVTLTLKNARKITGPTQLRVYGGPGTGLVSANGQFIDGNHDGAAGGDETAVIRKGNKITF